MAIVEDVLKLYDGDVKFKVIHHEKNQGLSAARNTGVRAATGDYLFFLDSDDELPLDSIKNFVQYLNKYGDADFLIGNYIVEGNFQYMPLSTPTLLEGHDNIMRTYLKGDWYMMACGKLISRKFFEKNEMWFAEKRLHEDDLFSFQLALKASKMITIQESVYKYIIRGNSITTAKKEKNYVDMFWIIQRKMELMDKYKLSFDKTTSFSYVISMWLGFWVSVSISNLNYQKKCILLEWIRTQLRTLDRQNVTCGNQLKYFVFFLFPCISIGLAKLIDVYTNLHK